MTTQKNGKKKRKEGKKEFCRTRTQNLRLDTTVPNRYTTEADKVILGESLWLNAFGWTSRRQDNQAPLTGLLTVKNNANAYSMAMNEWKNLIMLYKLYKTTVHVLVCKVGHKTCFVTSISAVILKLMVKITSIFGSYKFLRIAWHDIFSLLW